MYKTVRFLVLLLITVSITVSAQEKSDLEKALNGLLNDAGKAYLGPVGTAFGANLNSGWVHRAPQAKLFGFDLEVGFVAMGTMFQDENKTFNKTTEFKFSTEQATMLVETKAELKNPTAGSPQAQAKQQLINTITGKTYSTSVFGPTIVGKKSEEIKVLFPGESVTVNGQVFTIPGQEAKTGITGILDDLSALPLAAPQLTFGTIYGTSVSFRYLPSVKINDDLGEFKYFGFGLMHNPQAWLPIPLPVELSAAFFTQTMDVGKFFQAKATMFGIFASKKFGPGIINITPYAGFSVESSTIDVTYDVVIPTPAIPNPAPTQIKFSLEGENSTRITIGASLKILLINLNVDYSLAKYNVASAGLSFYF
ncbi:MAG: hypothetical protein HY965_03295 [Ignavibacteriales bacterium]|nr:hypothetical protein [Ignavibacteriales bacterium]